MKAIGFIGVGIMGKSMVRNLMKNGYHVSIYARHPEKVSDVVGEGAVLCESIAECAAGRDAVISIVGFPSDVESVYFDKGGILESASKGTCLIDMTTSSPALAVRIFEAASERGLYALDAPVTGGDGGAKAGTLAILVGGLESTFERCLPVFEAMGKSIYYAGKAGSGQHVKMANQIMIAGTLSGLCESITYMQAKGLNADAVLKTLATGAAGSRQLETVSPKILAGDDAPGFFIKHFIKDMRLAQEEAIGSNLHLDVLNMVLEHFETLQKRGDGDLGTQALMKYYQSDI
ncbi:MAG: 3-hydroxyisobutyrate dehydrogenase [Clostridiales bacterium]|nr:3-hydroxyisobutyrate dehydrogenase [Clostridiales bacterium]